MITGKKFFKFSKQSATVALKALEERPISSSTSKTINSFLEEVEHNYDIDSSIRKDIESKFKKSLINAHYRFPRSFDNDSKALPKLKIDRHLIDNELIHLERKKGKIKQDKKSSRKASLSSKYRILTQVKRPHEKKPACSVTPSPYVSTFKHKDIHNNEFKRSTPSPAPRNNVFTARHERNLF
ncbi:hypothetical protein SteCoe_32419 [Stentor coeruleus]|uniref:Uncharacterized protein n=1 Tax=Stentor coeruleus TaxID=5963 RepID=A0A1R2AZG5_9CILI|nr:hypothetical protein SteCoe_32419 [Stentor coeruleus]